MHSLPVPTYFFQEEGENSIPRGGKVGKNNWKKIEIDVDYGNKNKAQKIKGRVNGSFLGELLFS